jgi:hypothetical protein
MRYFKLLSLLSFILVWGCSENTKIDSVDLSFSVKEEYNEQETYVGKPLSLGIRVNGVDPGNDYPYTVTFRVEDKQGRCVVDNSVVENNAPIAYDFGQNKLLPFNFIPEEVGAYKIIATIENELVKREANFNITCKDVLYKIESSGIPSKPLVDLRFDFNLSINNADASAIQNVKAYAKVTKGAGSVYVADQVFSIVETGTDARGNSTLKVGQNTITYQASEVGENIIRFVIVNDWGYETSTDVPITIYSPDWDVATSLKGTTPRVPLDEDFTFNLNVSETDQHGGNEYQGAFRFISTNTTASIKINNLDVQQGASFNAISGTNIIVANSSTKGESGIEFTVRDKYGVEHKDTALFNVQLPLKEIIATVDKPTQNAKINQLAPVQLTLSEENYAGTFSVTFELVSGQGAFIGGTTQSLSAGTHDLGFTPAAIGTNTYKITIRDANEQTKVINVTVQCLEEFHIAISSNEGGKITGGGNFAPNETCSLVATPNNNYAFDGWYENGTKVSSNTTYTFLVTGNRTLSARFSPEKHVITVNALTGGTASGNGAYDYGASCTIRATPDAGYTFDGWYENGIIVSPYAEYTFTVTTSKTLVAKFTINKFNIVVNALTGGTVAGSGIYNQGDNCTVTVTVNNGYIFDGWYEGDTKVSTYRTYTFVVTNSRALEARFIIMHTVTVTASPGGSASGGGTFAPGENCTVHASVDEHYTFAGWYEGETRLTASLTYSFTVTSSKAIEARFNIVTHEVNLTTMHGGNVTGAGLYNYGSICNINATPNTGYLFDGWYMNDQKISIEKNYSFPVYTDRNMSAKFLRNTETFTTIFETVGMDGKTKLTYTTTQYRYINLHEDIAIIFYDEGAYTRGDDAKPIIISGSADISGYTKRQYFHLTPTSLGNLQIRVFDAVIMEFIVID